MRKGTQRQRNSPKQVALYLDSWGSVEHHSDEATKIPSNFIKKQEKKKAKDVHFSLFPWGRFVFPFTITTLHFLLLILISNLHFLLSSLSLFLFSFIKICHSLTNLGSKPPHSLLFQCLSPFQILLFPQNPTYIYIIKFHKLESNIQYQIVYGMIKKHCEKEVPILEKKKNVQLKEKKKNINKSYSSVIIESNH